jgi:hypothetical protein
MDADVPGGQGPVEGRSDRHQWRYRGQVDQRPG